VTKHAVVALSESLHLQLQARGARVGVSVLCPGWVRTRILEADRNRPDELGPPPQPDAAQTAFREVVRQLVSSGMDPAQVADQVVAAIRARRFYVLTHPDLNDAIRSRGEQVLSGNPPASILS
jgi:short-subunit dehydrogenase